MPLATCLLDSGFAKFWLIKRKIARLVATVAATNIMGLQELLDEAVLEVELQHTSLPQSLDNPF